jgi:hypothetical protein
MAIVQWQLEEPAWMGGLAVGVGGAVDELPKGVCVAKWPNMASGDVGAVFESPQHTEKHVTVGGVYGAGGMIRMEVQDVALASVTPRYSVAKDSQGAPMVFTGADGNPETKSMKPVTFQVRPNCAAGDGTTSLTVRMLVHL